MILRFGSHPLPLSIPLRSVVHMVIMHPPPPIIALNDLIFIKAKVEIVARGVGASLTNINEIKGSFAFNV